MELALATKEKGGCGAQDTTNARRWGEVGVCLCKFGAVVPIRALHFEYKIVWHLEEERKRNEFGVSSPYPFERN